MSINFNNPQPPGNYRILWSQSQLFKEGETKVLKEGVISSGAVSVTAQITVPESRYGIHFIRFKPDAGTEMNLQFTVLPGLKVSPSSARSGSTVSVQGNGFPANDVILFKFDNQYLDMQMSTGDAGSFTGKVVVPEAIAGSHKLSAITQLVSLSSSASVEVLPEPEKTKENDQETQNQGNTENPATTNNNNTTTIVPPEQDTISPPMPTPISPSGDRIGAIGDQSVTFEWTRTSDKNGVTYVLEVSDSHDFSSGTMLSEAGLTNDYYTAFLEPGIYYWRVKAVDHEGNESYWSYSPYAFKVGELSISINEFVDVLRNNSDIVIVVVVGFVSFIILSTLVSFIRTMTRPRK